MPGTSSPKWAGKARPRCRRVLPGRASEGPETAPADALHTLMQPYQTLEIALRCKREAQKYFESIAADAARVRAMAEKMAIKKREHARLIRDWLSRVPRPVPGEGS